ncbi:hypothetical protein KOR42_22120 [Thalassoglobus neptunius]|uniref:Uncharacterized protein n=1 Tax=Thalassoglobus neptunius TaxID=1938619 RepID=A0A5C5X704_9PLAN|nr:hypothetical protein [Thalassoglobus neptunius]TWT58826.1 hypothetical protein KOR42_22120 [Thalassoglobus neptunius]
MSPRMQQRLCFWSAGSLFVIGIALVTSPTTPTHSPTSMSRSSTDQRNTSYQQSEDASRLIRETRTKPEEEASEYVAVRMRTVDLAEASEKLTAADAVQAQHREEVSQSDAMIEQTSFRKTDKQASKLVQLVGVIAPVEDESK